MSSVKRRKTEKDASSGVKSKQAKESKKASPSPSPEPIEEIENNKTIEETEEAEEDEVVKSFKDLVRNHFSIANIFADNSRASSTHYAKHATPWVTRHLLLFKENLYHSHSKEEI